MKSFSDRLQDSILGNSSCLLAGFDPLIDSFPEAVLKQASSQTNTNEDAIYQALTQFYALALEALHDKIAAVKPNLAFFEQYGLAGLKAFQSVVSMIKERGLPVIADAKRADISTSAKAYSSAFLGATTAFGKTIKTFDCDALTVNPFLGFEALQPFIDDCLNYGKGLFVLVRTSNPEAAVVQANKFAGTDDSLSEMLAKWIAKTGSKLIGSCGLSGLGAVVGATHPQEAKALRALMPDNFLLLPGVGAQGASFAQAACAFNREARGAIINVSRGLLSSFSSPTLAREQILKEIRSRAENYNQEIKAALTAC